MTEETAWTPPTDWCPHPEYWHADTADATEHEVTGLIAAFVRVLQPELVVETGTNMGQTAEAIGRMLLANGHGRLVTCEIDPAMVEIARERCAGLPVTVLLGPGGAYAPEEQIGLLFLDSDLHQRHHELLALRPFLAPGAVVVVHDTGPQHPVHGYFQQLVDGKVIHGLQLRTPRGVSVYQA